MSTGVHAGDRDLYSVWPVSDTDFVLKKESWRIFVDRLAHGTRPSGTDARYDELQSLLEPCRVAPDGARRLAAEWAFADELDERYHEDGVDYLVRWTRVDE